MPIWLRKLPGIWMIGVALAGLAFTGYAWVKIGPMKTPLLQAIQSNLDLANDLLTTSHEMLVLMDQVLTTTATELTHLENSLLTMADLLQDADPLLDSLKELTGASLPDTLSATQVSLETARQSAGIIDTVLRAVTAIPFFPGEPYNPQIPLSESLQQISDNLSAITPSLQTIQTNLETTQSNLSDLKGDLAQVITATEQAQANLEEAQSILAQYQSHLNTAQEKLAKAQKSLPELVNRATWILTVIAIWLGLVQVGLLLQGITTLTGTRI